MFERFNNRTLRQLFGSQLTGNARIAVVGVGGGGGNAVNNMVEKGIEGVDFIAVNTDSQVLATNKADRCIQVGEEATGGLGAGARPELGAEALKESSDVVENALKPYDLVFITAGMGGGTGTGGAPVLASIAQELGILTVGIVTRPFECEGPRRHRVAERGIEQLRGEVDTLVVIPNESLLELANDGTSLEEAFWMVDEVLYDSTRGIVNLITSEGLINLDFADVERTMRDGGSALLGISTQYDMRQYRTPRGKAQKTDGGQNGTGETSSRPEEAAVAAISSPLFDGRSIHGADKALVYVTGGPSLGFQEVMSVIEVIQAEAGENCEVIFGAVTDESIDGQFQVMVIATGLDEEQSFDGTIQNPSQRLDQLKELNGQDREGDSVPLAMENGGEEHHQEQ